LHLVEGPAGARREHGGRAHLRGRLEEVDPGDRGVVGSGGGERDRIAFGDHVLVRREHHLDLRRHRVLDGAEHHRRGSRLLSGVVGGHRGQYEGAVPAAHRRDEAAGEPVLEARDAGRSERGVHALAVDEEGHRGDIAIGIPILLVWQFFELRRLRKKNS